MLSAQRFFRVVALLVLCLVASSPFALAQLSADAGWQWVTPTATSLSPESAVRFGDRWIIVGDRGSIHSLDGAGQLETRFLPVAADLTSIVSVQGKLVAGSRGSDVSGRRRFPTIWISRDGRNWESRPGPPYVSALTFADGKFVANVAQQIYTSTDGETWTPRLTSSRWSLNKTAFGNGLWVAVGGAGSIYTSPDAFTWTARTSGSTRDLNGVAWLNGRWVAGGMNANGYNAGELITSADGIMWSLAIETQTRVNDVRVFRDMFVAIGDHERTLLSSDGISWSAASTDYQSNFTALAVDGRDSLLLGRCGQILTSRADTFRWDRLPGGSHETYRGVDYAAGRFIAVGNGYDPYGGSWTSPIHTSFDGFIWTKWTPPRDGIALYAISHNDRVIVAAGAAGTIFTSSDGLVWSQRSSGLSFSFNGVASGPDMHVAVGDRGMIYRSTDGETWTRTSSPTSAKLYAATYGPPGFVALGDSGVVLSSRDGLQWTPRTSGTISPLYTAAWINGLGYITLGGWGNILRSSDGVIWTATPIDAEQVIVAIGNTPLGVLMNVAIEDVLLRSQDAVAFARDELRLSRPLSGFATGPNAIIAVGDRGTILAYPLTRTAGRLINLSIRTDLASAADTVTMGYVIGGNGTAGAKPLVIRAAGPSLAAFGLTSAVANPKLESFVGATKVGENDDWGGSASLSAAMAAVGAFPYASATSLDAAVAVSTSSRDNSVIVSGTGTGTVIAELYDATPVANFTAATPRLINVSIRKHLGNGVIAGFVLGGSSPTRVLVRAIGPTLGLFGVPDIVADPQLTLYSGQTVVASNNNWAGTTELTTAFYAVGAFVLPAASKDAAVVATLPPGAYTVQVSGVNNATGVALVEVYEVP